MVRSLWVFSVLANRSYDLIYHFHNVHYVGKLNDFLSSFYDNHDLFTIAISNKAVTNFYLLSYADDAFPEKNIEFSAI